MAWSGDHDPLDSLEEGTARSLVPVIPSPTRMILINDDGAKDRHRRAAAILARQLELDREWNAILSQEETMRSAALQGLEASGLLMPPQSTTPRAVNNGEVLVATHEQCHGQLAPSDRFRGAAEQPT